jgi:hypothetical protein
MQPELAIKAACFFYLNPYGITNEGPEYAAESGQ